MADGFGEQSVLGGHLVERRDQQRVVNEADAGCERAFYARDHEVEIVVGADRDLARRAGLGRIGIDVVELPEAGGYFRSPNSDRP